MTDREWLKKLVDLYAASQQTLKTNYEALDALYDALVEAEGYLETPRPTVVCLCGSTRFTYQYRAANLRETLKGNIVLSVGCDTKTDFQLFGPEHNKQAVKNQLDELHRRKIDLADEILVLNVGDYIGDSTRVEINYAKENNKRIRYLEPQEESK